MEKRSVLPGLILIAIGVALLVTRFVEVSGGLIVMLIGAAFGVAWLASKTYGLLVPASIMLGLGAGIMAEEARIGGDTIVPLGLGLGFLLIWPLDRLWSRSGPPHGGWWPFIPGGILTAVGIGGLVGDFDAIMEIAVPVAMVIVGAWLAFRAMRKPKAASTPPTAPPAAPPTS